MEKELKEPIECIHEWMIESPNGPTSKGKCLNCEKISEFKLSDGKMFGSLFSSGTLWQLFSVTNNTKTPKRIALQIGPRAISTSYQLEKVDGVFRLKAGGEQIEITQIDSRISMESLRLLLCSIWEYSVYGTNPIPFVAIFR